MDAQVRSEPQQAGGVKTKIERTNINCVPGDRLCKAEEKTMPAAGTYKSEDYIYASLAGRAIIHHLDKDVRFIGVDGNNKASRTLPSQNDIVTCQVTSIQTNMALCLIWCVNAHVLRQPFKGMVRKDDMRHHEKDLIEISKCCLPGDIILGKVIGVGDNGRYLITIADKEFGVVIATSEAGATMIPVGWTEMMCPKTSVREDRKVAKIKQTT
uniref:Exosome complex component CSL4 n=1 Tax=Aceria tosichella TaxID=561515 RepID=A0A6G1SIV0_9ACAR